MAKSWVTLCVKFHLQAEILKRIYKEILNSLDPGLIHAKIPTEFL